PFLFDIIRYFRKSNVSESKRLFTLKRHYFKRLPVDFSSVMPTPKLELGIIYSEGMRLPTRIPTGGRDFQEYHRMQKATPVLAISEITGGNGEHTSEECESHR
ncbi:hypothetical protein, partial [Desulfobulbus sp.]|uniref:hypothetical protein n=1 Tax=Desulfobulbus sp. TaxID=895 RepID=UPI00286F2831